MHSSIVLALLLCLFGVSISLSAQQVIYLENPSFEDIPQHSTPPSGWEDHGFEGQSPTDIHPKGNFGVYRAPIHGNTYLGMVVREDETYECIGQKLKETIKAGHCYQMEIAVTRSRYYISTTAKKPDEFTNQITPCVLRVWGGLASSEEKILLAVIGPVKAHEWQYYLIDLQSAVDCDYLYLEAFYDEFVKSPYNGNILVDNLSPIVPCELLEEGLVPRDFEAKDP